jgi:hypothetical protein
MCGGYFVTDVNRANPGAHYVNALDFSKSGLDAQTVDKALDGVGGKLVLRGKLGAEETSFHTRPFVVSDAWRGLPGVTAPSGDGFYTVESMFIQCFTTPCPTGRATRLNAGGATIFHEMNLDAAALPRVDQQWLTSRIYAHDALVSASFVSRPGGPGGTAKVLTASQVFVKLPEAPGPCPQYKLMACPSGQVRSFTRSVDRCELPAACVTPGVCPYFVPNCGADYSLQSWSGGQHACQVYACDPTFSL